MVSSSLQPAITVFFVDDHLLFIQSVTAMLDRTEDIKVIGSAGNGREAIRSIAESKPRVAVIDISMPGMDGLEVARRIRETAPQTEILILSMHNNLNYVYQAFKSGCRGYLLKIDSVEELQKAVRMVSRKETYISLAIQSDFIDIMMNKLSREDHSQTIFTAREQEICDHVAQGRSAKQIASDLSISPKTVRVHIANIMEKLSCRSRTELVLRLLELQGS